MYRFRPGWFVVLVLLKISLSALDPHREPGSPPGSKS
jgi:hypothetical protein